MTTRDPYLLDASLVREPPTSFWKSLPYLGPGFILSASIVGSGELIATTLVGAKAGFVLMWFIIFSCLVKVAVQIEFGKHAIGLGETTMASLNGLPGPRLGSTHWSIWTWLLLMFVKMMQVGGVMGGVVLACVEVFPAWGEMPTKAIVAYAVAISVSLLVYRGYYTLVARSLIMIGAFTLFTFASLISLQSTEMAITSGELWSGMVPSIPSETTLLLIAIGAFGITGVGGDEIMAYNYWLIEKGYAAYTGPKDDSADWARRWRGWIRVMYWDATLAMVAYTAVTVMFYLLGAATLNRQGLVPSGSALIHTLGSMYTAALGSWAKLLFIAGAIVVLYSTLFAALAAWTRMYTDAFGRIGLLDFHQERTRRRAIATAAWIIPFLWATLYLVMDNPALMVILGGLATVVILLIVVYAAIYFRYRRLDRRLLPSPLYDATLWISSVAIFLVAIYVVYDNVYLQVRELLGR